jgi:hypothetical protein
MAIKYINIFQFKDPPKFTQIGIFGLKANHLATLFYRQKTKALLNWPLGLIGKCNNPIESFCLSNWRVRKSIGLGRVNKDGSPRRFYSCNRSFCFLQNELA